MVVLLQRPSHLLLWLHFPSIVCIFMCLDFEWYMFTIYIPIGSGCSCTRQFFSCEDWILEEMRSEHECHFPPHTCVYLRQRKKMMLKCFVEKKTPLTELNLSEWVSNCPEKENHMGRKLLLLHFVFLYKWHMHSEFT